MKQKQTVYLPVNEQYEYSLAYWDKRDRSYQIEKDKNGEDISLKEQQGYFFTPEELNAYTQSVIKQALETAAENAEVKVTENALIEDGSCYTTYDDGVISVTSDKQSITNTFEETYKKFEV